MFRWPVDRWLFFALRVLAAVVSSVVLLLFAFLIREAWPAFAAIGPGRLLSDAAWHPAPAAEDGLFNLLPMLWGSLAVTVGAWLVAAPLGTLSAIWCHFAAPPWLARGFRAVVELLGGIPSVVYGLWGLVVLVPLIARFEPPGPSLLAGTLVLALMILPTIALTADAALASVPQEHLQAAAALGLSRWGTLCCAVLPAAWPGFGVGWLLAYGRAIGETMAILMVCGNVVQTPHGFFAPIRTLTANIALEMAYALGDHRAALFASGLVLLLAVVILVALAHASRWGRADV